ncbi:MULTISPECIES: phosphate signaling complex protein PhoU [Sphingomonadaceae]|jgi:phosphate transport system protein|uniref:Phosphate-specific transport system accessory protein PhoU n=1 Tax=Sphingobium soli TaxID=1591116 RepID=A0ABS8GZX0_9SPHN|nr:MULTISPECIES: phosphate signaling complex protein PhoU [Sphingomonadaceae]MEE2740083.1 phosphate signaling complex protein PhoU [Pseudomonadota bacterium]EAT10148.1 phosphate uptake regulator, PhoU [Sphingomonas sp. SKA58]MBA36999.1 phosphate transport system regulatory protein PhoU [Sphingobium sp.]MBS46365.1 phosphate transport system regulatory protein PhoU [Sphingobium sp.]MCC4231636.1 phosphate signaling complex protein PhoU [Sphingobium soli]
MAEHTIKAFDDEIDRLRGLIAEMGGRAEAAIENAMLALQRHDKVLAAEVVADDRRIDAIEAEVEKLVVEVIALRAPMANDLRDVIAALKIVSVVERIGDYAKNIAKRVPLVATNSRTVEPISLLPSMGQVAGEMVHDVLNAYAARDADLALAVVERDTVVDDFYNSVFRTLVTYMVENPKTISECAHLLFIAKNIERIGDHATNVAEMVYYAATGKTLPERERGPDIQMED